MGHSSIIPTLLLSILLLSAFQSPANAVKQSYIVYMGAHSHGVNPTSVDLDAVKTSHYNLLTSVLGSNEKAQDSLFYSYSRYINGFAALLDEEEAAHIAKDPNVVSVFPNGVRKLHTTHSWGFLDLEDAAGEPRRSGLWEKANFGENTIIANLDSGVWPESESFNNEGLGPIPAKWRGECDFETTDKVRCNNKLIGARYFIQGYLSIVKENNLTLPSFLLTSPRDQEGHGSHTLSTAAGSVVPNASVYGYGNGTAKGGSPRARVTAYKVCWPELGPNDGGCADADILAAFDAAISDGVDVISMSVGGSPTEFFSESIVLGAFHADKNGIVVVCSAGNSGPKAGTVTNGAPWILTVGASTIDREFDSYLSFGPELHFKGRSLSTRYMLGKEFYQVISAADASAATASPADSLLCLNGTLDPKKVKGKIVVCLRGKSARIEKGQVAALAGAAGFVLANDEPSGNEVLSDLHVIPATHITYDDGQRVFRHLNATKKTYGHITQVKTLLGVKPAPYMAAFSSRGPNLIEPSILKPDITAPGVDIIAAYTGAVDPAESASARRPPHYNIMSGTSMACPHVSGVVGLLKSLYPSWSPAAIRSAIITTARKLDNKAESLLDSTMTAATPLDYGAGHINPNRAENPGLVYDITTDDYLNFLCARGYNATTLKLFSTKPVVCSKTSSVFDLNYPTIAVPNLQGKPVVIKRKVKNVGKPGTYTAHISAPEGVLVMVKPRKLEFKAVGEEKNFKVLVKVKGEAGKQGYVFGDLRWSDGEHIVRSPIAVSFK